MKLKTGDLAKASYSPAEQEVFDFLLFGRANRLSSKQLVEKRYGASAPYHALSIIGAVIRSLSRKIEHNKEPFRVVKTARSGPNPTFFWLERRDRSKEK